MKKMIHTNLILIMIAFSLGCSKESLEKNTIQEDLKFSSKTLEGEWIKTGIFISDSIDSLGERETKENLMDTIADCRKDDIHKFTIESDTNNKYYWGYNEKLCEGQLKDNFVEIGSWTLDSVGRLNYFYADVMQPYQVINLTEDELLIRKKSGISGDNGMTYYFEHYRRQE